MALLTKDAIISVKDLETEDVKVPEWGGMVRVTMMTAKERDDYELSIYDDEKSKRTENVRAKLCAFSMVDEKGKRIFSFEDIKKLGQKSAKAVNRIFEVSKRLNAVGKEEMEELEKNLPEIPGEDLSSTQLISGQCLQGHS